MSDTAIKSLYRLLFGKRDPVEGDVVNFSEHGRVGGVSTGQGFKFSKSADLRIEPYSDSSYDYYCFNIPGASLSDSSWQIKRVSSAGQVTYPNGDSNNNYAATDLATVQGYSYS